MVLVSRFEGSSPLRRKIVDGKTILKLIFKKWNGGGEMDCIDLDQNRDR
jgi:hypothetical protein